MFFLLKKVSYKGKKCYLYIDSEKYYITDKLIQDNDISNIKIIKKGSILNRPKRDVCFLKELKKDAFIIFFWMIILYRQQIYENTLVIAEEPKTIQNYMNWNNLSLTEKENILITQIESLMKENKEWNEVDYQQILKEYKAYLEDYIEHFSKSDYLNTLLSTRFIEIEHYIPDIVENNQRILGVCTNKTIYFDEIKDQALKTNVIFHEKIHADKNWSDSWDVTSFYQELFTAYVSRSGYEDMRGAFSLLAELFEDKQILEGYLFKGENEKIWEYLKSTYPNLEDEIEYLKVKIEEIYTKEYFDGSVSIEEKIAWIIAYDQVYKAIYNQNPEEDLIIEYFTYQFLWNSVLENTNSLVYGNRLNLDDEYFIDVNHRKGNFQNMVLEVAFKSKNKKYKYMQNIMNSCVESGETEELSKHFLEYLKTFCDETEIKKIFYGMICCTNTEEVEIMKNYIFNLKYTQKLQLGK